MHLSFSLTGLDSGSSIPVGGHLIHLFLQSVGVTLTEVQDVVFRFVLSMYLRFLFVPRYKKIKMYFLRILFI